MSYGNVKAWLEDELQNIRDGGLYKGEKLIETPRGRRSTRPKDT